MPTGWCRCRPSKARAGGRRLTAPPDFYTYREQNRSLDHLEAFYTRPSNLTGGREPERLSDAARLHRVLRRARHAPAHGRGFVRQDEQWGSHRVAVLTTACGSAASAAIRGVVGSRSP